MPFKRFTNRFRNAKRIKKKEGIKIIVKAIYKDKNFNYFRDVETNDKRVYGDVFECDDVLAEKRIEKGLVKRANKKEEKEYLEQLEKNIKNEEQTSISSEETKDDENKDLSPNEENDDEIVTPDSNVDNETKEIKLLEECSIEELVEIAQNEEIELNYPKDDTAKDVIIDTINKVREERLEQTKENEQ